MTWWIRPKCTSGLAKNIWKIEKLRSKKTRPFKMFVRPIYILWLLFEWMHVDKATYFVDTTENTNHSLRWFEIYNGSLVENRGQHKKENRKSCKCGSCCMLVWRTGKVDWNGTEWGIRSVINLKKMQKCTHYFL